jgi:hypothetical protein
MRASSALLILLSCAGCALSQKPMAQNPAPQQAAAPQNPAPVADASSANFECSDGTISVSQTGCLVNMAHARLPPQPVEQTPVSSIATTGDPQPRAAR